MIGGSQFKTCDAVTPQCPTSATILSYQPNLGANAFFLAVFATCAVVQLVFGISRRTWTFAIALVLGCVCEAVGYVGRVMLARNPWDRAGFDVQIVCLIFAPTFLAAGVYLSLKHFVLVFGEEYSWIKAKWYTWLFIVADVFGLILQSAGGAISATGGDLSVVKAGEDIAIAGIAWQVFSLLVFGVCAGVYWLRVYRNRDNLTGTARAIYYSLSCRAYCAGIVVAYTTILIRCIYRIPELALGWRNVVMRNEAGFMVLDGAMMIIAAVTLTVVHPGFCFKPLSSKKAGDKSGEIYVKDDVTDSGSLEEKV